MEEKSDSVETYLSALEQETAFYAKHLSYHPIKTLYF
jgi:hypothetical protein